MSKKQKVRGMLQLVVTPKQGARAVRAAFGETYRDPKTGLIYQDNEDDWFQPIGVIKMAGTGPAESQTNEQGETQNVSIATTVSAGVKAIGKKLGISFDAEQVEQFRQCQKTISTKDEIQTKVLAVHARLQDAHKARRTGLVEFDGIRTETAVENLSFEHSVVADQLSRIHRAESEAIGLCPDHSLQRRRRQLNESRKLLSAAKVNIEQRLDRLKHEQRRLEENLAGQQEEHSPRERAQMERDLATNRMDIEELNDEKSKLDQDAVELETERQELFAEMRALKV